VIPNGTYKDIHLIILVMLGICVLQDFSDDKPLSWSHFTAEGDVEFKAVLYVPPKAPQDLYESYYNSNKSNLKLYVRRVFISDEFDELLPKYLSFLTVSLICCAILHAYML
jgi:HSP90 family molecular chaperone